MVRRVGNVIVPVSRGTPLLAGDSVVVERRAVHILLTLDSGQSLRICQWQAAAPTCDPKAKPQYPVVKSPFRVPDPGKVPGVSTNVFRWLGKCLSLWNEQEQSIETITAAVPRGPGIFVPVLAPSFVHWKIGTIAGELNLHPDAVRHAVETEQFNRAQALRPCLTDPYLEFIR